MNDLHNFFSGLHSYYQALLIGIAGGILGKNSKNPSMNGVKGWRKLLIISLASASSAFTCLIVYLIAHPLTNSEELALGIGGYCAWQGAEWTKQRVGKMLDRRISDVGYSADFEDRRKNGKGEADTQGDVF